MTLDQLARLLDRFSAASRQLADHVAHGDDAQIQASTSAVSDAALALQRSAPQVQALLARCPPEVRSAWRERLLDAARPAQVGAELAGLNAAQAASRFAVLAEAAGAGAGVSYARGGQIGY